MLFSPGLEDLTMPSEKMVFEAAKVLGENARARNGLFDSLTAAMGQRKMTADEP